jgi:hypothetical protein
VRVLAQSTDAAAERTADWTTTRSRAAAVPIAPPARRQIPIVAGFTMLAYVAALQAWLALSS